MPVPSVGTIQKALQVVIAPEMHLVKEKLVSLEGQITAQGSKLTGEIAALEGKLTGEIRALQSEVRRLDNKIDNLSKRLDEAMEIRERLATLEAKLRQ